MSALAALKENWNQAGTKHGVIRGRLRGRLYDLRKPGNETQLAEMTKTVLENTRDAGFARIATHHPLNDGIDMSMTYKTSDGWSELSRKQIWCYVSAMLKVWHATDELAAVERAGAGQLVAPAMGRLDSLGDVAPGGAGEGAGGEAGGDAGVEE